MSTVYFDNFRGFARTFLDLREVNFFVGENSTGKTSVLKLIGILSSQDFWRYGEFGKDETGLGSFEDIISTSDEAKSYLEIGFHEDDFDDISKGFAIRIRYIDNNKLPFLKEICYRTSLVNIQAIIEGKIVKYRFEITEPGANLTKLEFQNWVDDNGLNELSFSKVDLQNIGIIPILAQINNEIIIYLSKKLSGSFGGTFGIQLPKFTNKLAWIAPIRAEPLRTYRNGGIVYKPDGSHSPSVLKEIFDPEVRHILNKFGADSGLFEDIITKDLYDIDFLELIKGKGIDAIKEKIGQSEIFEVRVTINHESRNIVNVGYGVSQVLPILIEAIAREDETWFATQQPEVHLHPRAQAALGDFFYKCNVMDQQKFIIETHSDYIIDRFRLRLNRAFREKEKKSGLAQILFFSKTANGNAVDVIVFNDDGSYPDDQPNGFRNFFIKEQLDIISI